MLLSRSLMWIVLPCSEGAEFGSWRAWTWCCQPLASQIYGVVALGLCLDGKPAAASSSPAAAHPMAAWKHLGQLESSKSPALSVQMESLGFQRVLALRHDSGCCFLTTVVLKDWVTLFSAEEYSSWNLCCELQFCSGVKQRRPLGVPELGQKKPYSFCVLVNLEYIPSTDLP